MSTLDDPDELQRLAARATQAARGVAASAVVHSIEPLSGGHSSITYVAQLTRADAADERIVLKVAPVGSAPVKNRDMLRQARVLSALRDAPGVNVPEMLFASAGAPPEIPPFFAMAYVEGDSIEPLVDGTDNPAGPLLGERCLAGARMLGTLHGLDVAAIGLGDEEVTSLTAEVQRWVRSFASVEDDLVFDGPAVGARLLGNVPEQHASVLVHGDYRLGNMQCVGTEIRAVVDWEIWGVGDGRLDLAWYLLMLDAGYSQRRFDVAELPSSDTLRTVYEDTVGRTVEDLQWFEGLVRFKQAATTALITKQERKRGREGFRDAISNLLVAATAKLDERAR